MGDTDLRQDASLVARGRIRHKQPIVFSDRIGERMAALIVDAEQTCPRRNKKDLAVVRVHSERLNIDCAWFLVFKCGHHIYETAVKEDPT